MIIFKIHRVVLVGLDDYMLPACRKSAAYAVASPVF